MSGQKQTQFSPVMATQREVGERFGVSRAAISNEEIAIFEKIRKAFLNDADVIRWLKDEGYEVED